MRVHVTHLLKQALALVGYGDGSLGEAAPQGPKPRPQVLLVQSRVQLRQRVKSLLREEEREGGEREAWRRGRGKEREGGEGNEKAIAMHILSHMYMYEAESMYMYMYMYTYMYM